MGYFGTGSECLDRRKLEAIYGFGAGAAFGGTQKAFQKIWFTPMDLGGRSSSWVDRSL